MSKQRSNINIAQRTQGLSFLLSWAFQLDNQVLLWNATDSHRYNYISIIGWSLAFSQNAENTDMKAIAIN